MEDSQAVVINNNPYTIKSDIDNDGDSYVKFGDSTITTKTDDFGRAATTTTKINDSLKYSVKYTYKKGVDDNSTTKKLFYIGVKNEKNRY